jgi:ABC-type nitrate/sulfonate/bicarbonate transport system substrate-binding protein
MAMKIRQKLKLAALGLMLVLLVIGCGKREVQPPEKIVLGTQTIVHNAPVWIAQNKDYFREEGLNVEIREFDSGQAALKTLLHDKGINLITASQTPVVYNSFQRNDYA